MAADTLTIADFILARVAEDEAFAQKAQRGYQHVLGIPHFFDPTPGEFPTPMVGMTPRSALAQCKAHRAIVEQCRPVWMIVYRESDRLIASGFDLPTLPTQASSGPSWPHDGAESTLHALASIWSDHKDWREEWSA